MTVDFCLPVYNEEQILESNILTLLEYLTAREWPFEWKIVIVVNGSEDGSLDIAKRLCREYPRQVDCVNFRSKGKGQALKRFISQSKADVVMYMDIDLAVSLDNIHDLLSPITEEGHDLVMGSRLLSNSQIDRSFIRELSSQTYNLLSRFILNHKFSDLQCGFKAVKTDRFQGLVPFIESKTWFFDTELVVWGKRQGLFIREIPVNWSENRYEKRKSKINLFRDSFVFTKNLFNLRKKIKKQG